MQLAARLTLIASILALIYMPLTAAPQGIQQNSNTEEAVSQSAETEGEGDKARSAENVGGIKLPEVVVEDLGESDEDEFTAEDAVGGTKTDTPLIEVPQSVSVVTEEQIEKQAAQSVGAALRYTPGVNAQAYGFDSRYDWIFIRGFLAPKFLDGLQLPYGVGYADPKVEPYGLERIEILKGPSSSLYGQVPPGGLVSMISKRPTPFPLHEVLLQYGSYDRYQGAFDLGGPIDERG